MTGSGICRGLALLAGVLALLVAGQVSARAPAPPGDMSMGNPHAKVVVTEYASVACPFCAEFNNTVFPEFKKRYIDTGKVRYVAREALTGNPTLAVSGFLLARCAGKGKYFQVTDAIYRAQDEIYEPGTETMRAGKDREILLGIAKAAGLNEDQFTKCISDGQALAALDDRVRRFAERDGVEATPTFLLNGKTLKVGPISMPELDAAIRPLLAKTRRR